MTDARALHTFIAINLVNGVGDGLLVPTSVLFFVSHVGLSGAKVATGLSIAGLVAALLLTPLARLAERIGLKRALGSLYLIQAVSVAAYILVDNWWTFVILVAASASAGAAVIPVRQAMIGHYAGPQERMRLSATNRSAYNASFAIGAVIAGLVVGLGTGMAYDVLVLGDALSFVAAAAVAATLGPITTAPSVSRIRWRILTDDRAVTSVAALIGVMYLYGDVVAVGLPLTVLHSGTPAWIVSAAFLLNTVLTVLLQIRLSRNAADAPSAGRIGARAGVLFLVGSAMVGAAVSGPSWWSVLLVLLGVVVLTLGELWSATSAWGLSYALSPSGRADEIGLFSLGGILMRTVSPSLVAIAVLNFGYFGWLMMGSVMAVAGLLLIPASTAAHERIRAVTALARA